MSRPVELLATGALLGWAAVRLLREREWYSFAGKTVLVTGGSRGLGSRARARRGGCRGQGRHLRP